jgi:hypothetical protein
MPARLQFFRTILLRLALLTMLAMSLRAAWHAYTTADPIRGVVTALAVSFTLVALVIHIKVTRWNRRFERGRCPICDYDMRATPDRCPECGHEVTFSETTLPRWLNGTALDLARDRTARSTADERR